MDTLNQTLGDSEENGAGMQAFLINANKLAVVFGCAVFAANHVGHADKARERGGSQIKGNSDTRLLFERVEESDGRTTEKTFKTLVTACKVKNGEDGFSLKATLRKFVSERTKTATNSTTLVVESVEAANPTDTPKPVGKPITKTERARRGFVEMYHQLANSVDPTPGLDGRTKVLKVKADDVRDRMRDFGMLDCYDKSTELTRAAQTLFSTVKAELTGRRVFIEFKGQIWRLYPAPGGESKITFRPC